MTTPRRCRSKGCDTVLSRYNDSNFCGAHPRIRIAQCVDVTGRQALVALAPCLAPAIVANQREL